MAVISTSIVGWFFFGVIKGGSAEIRVRSFSVGADLVEWKGCSSLFCEVCH